MKSWDTKALDWIELRDEQIVDALGNHRVVKVEADSSAYELTLDDGRVIAFRVRDFYDDPAVIECEMLPAASEREEATG